MLLPGVGQPLEAVERPLPEPGDGEVRVRVEACGVCGSDLFLQSGGFGADRLPRVPGHEAAGVVDALGPGVDGIAPGDQVALYYIDADQDGRWARAGRENLEPRLTRMGVDVDGAFAEYVVRPAYTLIRPPEPVDPATLAVLTDAVATPFHALTRLAQVQPGETLLVIGVGGVGSNAIQLGRHLGAHVVAATRGKRELAVRLGAHEIVPSDDSLRTQEADVVLQCAGSAALDELAIGAAGPGGRVVLVGASTERFSASSIELIRRELSVMGSRGFTKRDIAEVIDLHLAGAIATDHLTSAIRPLGEANEALADLREGRVLRTVLSSPDRATRTPRSG
jgi:propanol-preferring alcohol dehydrogenase